MQRIALIGCGNISRFHLAAWREAGAEITWVCDLNEAVAQRVAATCGARSTTNYHEALADPRVTTVDVTTFSGAHRSICIAAFAAGKHVVCEKTLAENAEDAWAITTAALDANKVLFTSYMKRYLPAVQRMKGLLPSLGKLLQVNIKSWQGWGDVWNVPPAGGDWTRDVRQRYGGGILVCGGSHIIDLTIHLCGRPSHVTALVRGSDERNLDLSVTALLNTPACPVQLSAIAHPHPHLGFLRDGWDEQIEILGTAGRLHLFSSQWDDAEHKAPLLIHDQGVSTTEHRFAPTSPFARAMLAFQADLDAGINRVQSRFTGYETDAVIAAILASSAQGSTVAIPWKSSVSGDALGSALSAAS